MRRSPLIAVAILLSGAAVVRDPAAAGCGYRGTLTPEPTTITIGQGDAEPYRTIYVDDRNYNPLSPTDEEQHGIWVYAESNGAAGLQRGAQHPLVEYVPELPWIGPIVVIPPDRNRPVLGNGLTLFPGHGPSPPAEIIGWYDGCVEYGGEGQPTEPDTLLF